MKKLVSLITHVCTVFLVSEESCRKSDTQYDSDGNSGPSFEQIEDKPNFEAYHKDKVVARKPVGNQGEQQNAP